jgi:hypothetical protein
MLVRYLLVVALLTGFSASAKAQAAAQAVPASGTITVRAVPAAGIQMRATAIRAAVMQQPGGWEPTLPIASGAATGAGFAAAASPSDEAAKAAENEKKQKRLQKIQQLQFDRRPSTILKTWLEPVPKPPVKAADKPADSAPAATAPAAEAPAATAPIVPAEGAAEFEMFVPACTQAEAAATEAPAAETPATEAAAETTETTTTETVTTEATTEPAATETTASEATEAAPAATTDAPAETVPEAAPATTEAAAPATPEAQAAAEKEAAEKAAAEAKAAEAKAAEEQKKAEEAAKKLAEEEAQFDYELKLFTRNVTLGQWADVKAYLASLDKEEGKALYEQMLNSLLMGAAGQPQGFDMNAIQQMITNAAAPAEFQKMLALAGQGQGAMFMEKNQYTMRDLLGLIVAAPMEPSDQNFAQIGTMLRQAIVDGNDLEVLMTELHVLPDSKEPALLTDRQVAKLLFAAVEPVRAGQYLPTIEEAAKAQDAPGLNLIARYYLALHQTEAKDQHLVDAWNATQAVLAIPVPEGSEEIAAAETVPDAGDVSADEMPSEGGEAIFGDPFGCNQVVVEAAADASVEVPATAEPAATEAAAAAPAAATPAEPTAEEKAAKEKAEKEAKEAEQKRIAELKQAKLEAMQRAVELAPKVRKELGQTWLDEGFTKEGDRGREILAAIGTMASQNMMIRPQEADFRLKTLQLERAAVEALLRAAPDKAKEWNDTLTMLAAGWLKEAQISYDLDQSASNRPGYRRDRYGNYFFYDEGMGQMMPQYNNGMAQPIPIAAIMETRPSDAWLDIVHVDLKPKFAEMFAQIHLKLSEDAQAFPYIERLAATHPKRAKTLAEKFLQVWTTNHNPNEGREGYDPYFYYYGMERRAERIPLTRSKQERNLKELAELIRKLQALPIEEMDERLLTSAFTTAHSHAEVYKLESIETVFGSMDTLKPKTLASLIQQMRGNLAGVWRAPAVQDQNSTKRKQKDIQAEVVRGYQVARAVVDKGLAKYPDNWSLVLADAAVMFDEIDFQNELEKSSGYSESRAKALARFQQAAELYAKSAGDLRKDEQTTEPFELWYYASLGSVDLARITADKVPDLRQPALIRDTLATLPDSVREHHLELFANNLFSRVSNAKPELKFRYLRTGFEIVGDQKMAREARQLLDYYADLVQEIKLETRVDGSDVIGAGKPFGVFVNLVHTKEIERESGGFGRYLQNQNNNTNYYYNFGRPLENYRDKFHDIVNQALGEQFDILSVTFQEDTVTSKALPEYGWRVTPYAYVLLKARGPEVDKIAPLRLDLDFLDTSGYAILPVESPALPVDASGKAAARPAADITITQTLDERQADEGKLVLEIRASAHGLVPELDQLVDFKHEGFEVAALDDGGPAVTKFDNEADDTVVTSERLWTISLKPEGDGAARPEKFAFAAAKLPVKEIVYQRYEDADLVPVEREFALQQKYAETSYAGLWVPILGVTAAAIVALFGVFGLKKTEEQEKPRFAMPEPVTPFTVIGLLRDIQANNGLTDSDKTALRDTIGQLERHYFLQPAPVEPDLNQIAHRWLEETTSRQAAHNGHKS